MNFPRELGRNLKCSLDYIMRKILCFRLALMILMMPNREYNNSATYRFGLHGKERESIGGGQYDYGFRIYDPRLVRFKSVDPLTKSYPRYTPYHFAGNKLITSIDLDGLEEFDFRERCEDDGSITIIITTGRDALDQARFAVSTATGTTNYFKYRIVQEQMSKVKRDNQLYSSGKQTPENRDGFTVDIPLSEHMRVNITPALDRTESEILNQASSIVFSLAPNEQELYHPIMTASEGSSKQKEGDWGNAQFTYSIELTSGQVSFEYDNNNIPDSYTFTDAEGNSLYQTPQQRGKGEHRFEFKDLKTPIINVIVTSSDKASPGNSLWGYSITIQETEAQKQQRLDQQKSELPCVKTP